MSILERETAADSLVRRRGRPLTDRPGWLGALMIAPAVLYIVLIVGMPFVLALYYSVSDITAGSRSLNFVGLKNFADIVGTSQFRTALRNTFVFAIVSQAIVLVGANILALALMRDFRGKWLVRLLLLLPWVAPISLGTIGWLWILDSIYSVINWTLEALGLIRPNDWPMWLGIPPRDGLGDHGPRVAALPLATIILLAGLSSIPKEIHEAARGRRRLLAPALPDHARRSSAPSCWSPSCSASSSPSRT